MKLYVMSWEDYGLEHLGYFEWANGHLYITPYQDKFKKMLELLAQEQLPISDEASARREMKRLELHSGRRIFYRFEE